jgi:hypothetical protein
MKNLKGQTKLGVRKTTKAKFDRIAKAKRWTLAEAADAVADDFIAKNLSRGVKEVAEMKDASMAAVA